MELAGHLVRAGLLSELLKLVALLTSSAMKIDFVGRTHHKTCAGRRSFSSTAFPMPTSLATAAPQLVGCHREPSIT